MRRRIGLFWLTNDILKPASTFKCCNFESIRAARFAKPAAAEPPSLPGEMTVS
jgi:hypothetical protein